MDARKITFVIVIVLVAVGAAWAMGYIGGTDPVVAEMQQLRDQMFTNRDLPEDQRRAQWQDFRQRMDGLTDAQRQALWEDGRQRWEQFGQQRMDEFFTMPPDQQRQRLDQMIDRMLARQEGRAQNPNANGNGGGRGNRGGRNLTEGQRDQRSKERIARTDPKMRAQRDKFRDMMNDRLKQRGLPPIEGGPGRGGFGGGPWRG
jgi:hypothetical protein